MEVQGGLLGGYSPYSSVSLSAKTDTLYLDANGEAIVRVSDLDGGSVDSCGQLNLFLTDSLLTCADLGQREWVLFGFSSADSLVVSDTTIITVLDTLAPEMVCQNYTITLDADNEAGITVQQLDGGSSDNCGLDSLWLDRYALDCADVGHIEVTLFARDSSGNSNSCTAQVTVESDKNPVALCRDIQVYLDQAGQVSVSPEQIDNGSLNGCDPDQLSLSKNVFSCSEIGPNEVTLTVFNQSGMEASCTAQVTVIDTISPSVEADPATLSLNNQGQATLDPDDFWEVVGPVTTNVYVYGDNRIGILRSNAPGISSSHSGYYLSRNGTDYYRVVHTGSDPSWHYFSFSPYVASGSVFGSTGTYTFALYQNRGYSDACSVPDISLSETAFTCSDLGTHTVTLTATDESGNITTVTEQVTVVDQLPPTVLTQSVYAVLDESLTATIGVEDIDDGSYDNCSIATRSLDRTTFSCADIGSQTVTLTITDQSGNSAQATATVFVVDSVPPVARVRDTVLYLNEEGQAFLSAEEVNDGSTDNCFSVIAPGVGELSFDIGQTAFNGGDVGIRSVHFLVFDAYGNYDETLVQVEVRDTIPPVAVCQPQTVFLDERGQATVFPAQVGGGSTDQAGMVDLLIARDAGLMGVPLFGESLDLDCEDTATSIPVLLQVTDAGGNAVTCQTTIELLDSIAPVFSCQPQTAFLDGTGMTQINAADFVMQSADACGIDSLSVDTNAFSCGETGTHPVTLTAFDPSGNATSCQTTVTVLDTLAPVVLCKDTTIYVGDDYLLDWYPPAIDNGSYDNCGSLELSLDKYFVPCFETGDHLVTLTATDDSGNSASCTSTVTALDTAAPTVSCTDVTLYLDATGQAVLGDPFHYGFGYDDNCGYPDTTIFDRTHFGCGDIGQNTITFTGVDQAGNSATCTSTVTVIDTIPPSEQCADITVYLDQNGQFELSTIYLTEFPQDACGLDTMFLDKTLFTCADVGEQNITITAMDVNGNEISCTSTVTVLDTVAPLAMCRDVTVYLDQNGEVLITPDVIEDGSTDACGISILELNQTAFSCPDVGEQMVTLTVTDQNGNTSNCAANLMVSDTIAPEVTAKTFLYLDLTPDTAYLSPDQVIETVFEACGQDSVWLSRSLFTEQDTGLQWVQWYVRDVSGNITTDSLVVHVVAPMVLATELTHESCFESNDGAIDLSVRAGVPPYRYLWSTGAKTTDLANLEAGTYTVTVTDARDHTATKTVQVTQPQPLMFSLFTQDASCFSESDGFITTNVQGGTEPYSYQWSTGATTPSIANIPAGSYGLTVTDANQCRVLADTTITEPADFSVEPVADIGPVCNGDAVRVLFAPDAPETTFTWTNTNPAIGLPAAGQGALDFSALNETMFAQTGSIEVTPHYDGCTGNPDTFDITVACPAVAGQVRWYRTGAGLEGVAVEQMGDATQETQTDAHGAYEFSGRPGLQFLHHPSFPELTLTGEDLPVYGIDENDVQRLQEHLDGGTPLGGYDLLAADINDNGQLSSADLVLIQYALQGVEEPLQFFERQAWKFVDAATQVEDSLILNYSDTLAVNDRHGLLSDVSWLGVRKGDLTGSNGTLDYDPVIPTRPDPIDPVDARTDAPNLRLAVASDQTTATCGDIMEAVVIAQEISGGDTISLLTLDAGIRWAPDQLSLVEATAGHFRGGDARVFAATAQGQVSLTWKDLVAGGVPVVVGDTLLTLSFEVVETPGLSTIELATTPATQPAGALSYLVGFQYSENWESNPAQVEFVPETTDFELTRIAPYTVTSIDAPMAICDDATSIPVEVSFQQMAEESPTHFSIDFFAEAESMGLTDVENASLPPTGQIVLSLPENLVEGTIAFNLRLGDGADCYSEPLNSSVEVVTAPDVVLTGISDVVCPGNMLQAEAVLEQPEAFSYTWQMCASGGTDCRTLGANTNSASFMPMEPGDYEIMLTVTGGLCGEVTIVKAFTVQELPTITYPLEDDELVYCQGTEVYLAFTADLPGTTFHWLNTNTDIGLAASGTGPVSFTASNTGVTTVTVTPVTSGCEGDPVTFTVQVQAGTPNAVSLNLSQDTLCIADAAQMVTTMPAGGTLSGPGTSSTSSYFTPVEAGAGTHILVYTYGDDGCSSTASDTVVVLPEPAVQLPEDTSVCAASPVTLTISGTPNATIWYRENGMEKSLLLNGAGLGNLYWPSLTENLQIQYDSIGFSGSMRCVALTDEVTMIEMLPEINPPLVEMTGTTCPNEPVVVEMNGQPQLEIVYQLAGQEPDSLVLPADGDTSIFFVGLTETTSLELLRARRHGMDNCLLEISEEPIDITIWEKPELATAPNTFLCSGDTFEVDLNSLILNDVPVNFTWEVLSETATTGATGGTGNEIRQVLENKMGETISLVYRVQVTPQVGDCPGQILLLPVQVFSEPVAELSVPDQTICPGDALQPIQIAVTNGMTTQTSLSWKRDGLTEVSGVVNGIGNQISGLLTNTTQTDQTVTYSVYQEATNGCVGDTLTSIVRLPIDATAPEAVCPPVVGVAVNRVSGVRMYGEEVDAGSTDNCGIYEYSLSMDSVGWNERGTHDVTLTVRDVSGNADDCTFRLEVTEEQACRAQLNVRLDEQGQYELTPAQVITGVIAPGLRIQVDDAQPGNGAIVDCPGEYRYAIFDESDALVCWGYVLAEDKSAPTVVGLTGKKDSLICTYVDQLANNPATVDPANRYYLGHVTFTDNTADCEECTLPEVTFIDRVEYLDCPVDLAFGAEYVYARMYRTFLQKDCHGNERDTTVTYIFIRPPISDLRFPISDLSIVSCNPDTVTIPDTLGLPYLVSAFGDTLTLAEIDCQYAWSVEDQTFSICEGRGLKVERIIRVMDWCAEESGTPFDTVLIKIGDFEEPELHGPLTDLRVSPYSDPVDFLKWYDTVYIQSELLAGVNNWEEVVALAREQGNLSIISTGPADCTGALLLEQDWVEQQFGVSVSDNCELREVGYELLQYSPENKGQEITGNYRWRSTNYQLQGNTITGLPTGIYALAITGRDYCGLSSIGLILFTVEDQIVPVMTCDDQVTVTLSQEGLANIRPADLAEGSWDNCGPVSLALRQKNTDTLWQQELWLDCSQVNGTVLVEVQGTDAAGNTNTCWTEVIVEDKINPLCSDLAPVTLACDDPGLQDLGSFGLPETPFSTCGNIDILELDAISDLDQCGVGTITRQFVAVKDQGSESEQRSDLCEQVIEVVAHHDYWLAFPADQTAACARDVSIRGVAFAEEACDLIAISHTDERFYATQDPEACYKIFRTYRVINWCEYDGEASPTIVSRDWDGWNGENPRHPDGDDAPGDEDMYVIVKRNLADGHRDTVFYDNNPNPHDGSIQQDGITYDYWWAVLSGNNDPATEDYYEGIPGHVPGCTDCHSTWSYDGDQKDSDIAGNVQGDDADFRYGSFGYWQYTQHIVVYDDVAPALTITGIDTFCSISNEDCSAPVELTISATDLCTDDKQDVSVSIALDIANDGIPNADVTGNYDPATGLFSGRYPLGEHRLVVTVNDGCGNQIIGDYVFTVVDCKAPAPIVIDALSVELMPSDSDSTGAAAVVWADDFVASPVYDCNGQDGTQADANGNPLVTRYSINRVGEMPDPAQDHLYVNCTEAVRSLEVEIHAWDEAGNHDFATTFLLVQDNMGLCEEPVDGAGGITGAIATEHNLPIPNVEVRLSGSAQRSYLTDQRGGYSLFGLEEGGDYTVTPSLNSDPLNGVSTFDLVLISKHILGLQPLESPYQQIAADINRSGTVTTLDLIQLRKLILKIDTEFKNNTSWRFVDADYGFRQNSNPLEQAFPEVKNINNLEGEEVAEFVAIKVGDVNGNANVAEVRSLAGTFNVNVAEQELKAGSEYRIPVTTEQLNSVLGYQFTLEVDPANAEIVDLEYGVAAEEYFGVFADKGIITSSFNQPNSTFNIQHSTLFTLVLRPTIDTKVSDVLRISSKYTVAEAYATDGHLLNVRLNVGEAPSKSSNELYQNSPNPFQSETSIGFFLAKAGNATMTIRDMHGRTVYTASGTYGAGYQQVRLREQELSGPGVYTYTLETDAESMTRKMVLGIR